MSKRVSFADQIYDRFCNDYVLKTGDRGGALVQKKLLNEARASSYEIGGLGRLVLLRNTGLFGPKQETALFLPYGKDAPVLRVCSSYQGGKPKLDIQFPVASISPVRYQQFSRVKDSFDRLQDAAPEQDLRGADCLPGSASKTGSSEELSAMLEEYLSAYLRVLEMAPACDRMQKQERLSELAETYLKNEGDGSILTQLAAGQDASEFARKHIFNFA